MASHSAAFPSVIAAIVSVSAAAVAPVRVVRGRDFSNDPGDVVMVGIGDIREADWDSAGTFQQTMQGFGGGRSEVGEVNGLIVATDGQGDQAAALAAAFNHLALIEAAIRADKTLGVTGFDDVVAELAAGDVTESQNDSGASAVLAFVIAYKVQNL